MKSAQFFQTVVFTGATVTAVQEGNKGYKLVAMLEKTNKETSEVTKSEVVMETINDEPRYFKSVASIPAMLRDKDIYLFSVQIDNEDIKKRKRVKKSVATAKKTTAKAPALATM